MRKQKTIKKIEVDLIRKECNYMLAHPGFSQDKRKGIIEILTFILWESGQYNGYTFIDTKAILEGTGDETKRVYL